MLKNAYGSSVEVIQNYGGSKGNVLLLCRVTFAPGTEQESSRIRYMWSMNLYGTEEEVSNAIAKARNDTRIKNEMLIAAMMEANSE